MLLSVLAFASSAPVLAGLVAATAIGASASSAILRKRRTSRDVRAVGSPARGGRTGFDEQPAHEVGHPAALERRMRARLSPSRGDERDECKEDAIQRVIPFIERSAEYPVSAWLKFGEAAVADEPDRASRSTARAILDATIADRRMAVAAWLVRDAVDTAAFLVRHSARDISRLNRRHLVAAQQAIEEAALAMLAQRHLSRADVEVLCARVNRFTFAGGNTLSQGTR